MAKEDRRPPKPPPGPRLALSVASDKKKAKLEEEVSAEEVQALPAGASSVRLKPARNPSWRLVLQSIKELKAEAKGQSDFYVVGLAIPNRKRPKAEHHWLLSNLIIANAPWDESLEVPKTVLWMGQGRNRVTYDLGSDVLKLISGSDHGNEMQCSATFPTLCAHVSWQGSLKLQWNNAKERGIVTLQGLIMRKCYLVKPWLLQRQGTVRAYEFLAYALVLVNFLFNQGVQLRDIGGTNLAVLDLDQECPTIAFIDMQEWEKTSTPKTGPSHFWELAKVAAPAHLDRLKNVVNKPTYKGNVEALRKHCYAYHEIIRKHGILDPQSRVLM